MPTPERLRELQRSRVVGESLIMRIMRTVHRPANVQGISLKTAVLGLPGGRQRLLGVPQGLV